MESLTAQRLAVRQLAQLGQRWAHVEAVGQLADSLVSAGLVSEDVAAAAWLHDVGYAPSLVRTGFHALDGARFIADVACEHVVALVAHHTGSAFEAEQRGLAVELAQMPTPDTEDLDTLTLVDLVVGPDGGFITPEARLDEVLRRYGADTPVRRAVTRSRPVLLAAAARARTRLGLSDEWPLVSA